ncbi:hypothetical protein KT99_20671 [Shewanella benthica KT99]|uniref:Uncharacterized protein n=1 Tax=Shewanella benthica KT99 TaxID=314608 RepID=A9D728_9GAMM|nr:hypothetical protein KT99_20671 [Shewanella benthica KT99]
MQNLALRHDQQQKSTGRVKLNSEFDSQKPSTKERALNCNNCDRLTVIEGESICFRQGEIISLSLFDPHSKANQNLPHIACDGWKAG